MANDIQGRIGQILGSESARSLAGTAFNEALKAVSSQRSSNGDGGDGGSSRGALSGMRGLAAGAGAAAAAPLAAKGIGKLIKGNGVSALAGGPKKLVEDATSTVGDTVEGKLKDKVEDAGGPSGILKEGLKSALPFGGGGGSGKQDAEGVGKGRRMPIQQSVDIALPLETVYNQWTQFEEWPKFMHRVTRASQEDPCKVNFSVKIWGKTKEFTADIETQRPNDRIKWKTTQGMNHTGVVTFRELGPNLTRVMLSFDLAPGGLLEKYARGTRHVKRAARADLHRLVAFIEMIEHETGAWRGVIEDGELVEDHDPSYDEEREYGDADELVHGRGSDDEDDEDSEDDDDDDEDDESSGRNGGEPESRTQRPSTGSRQGGRGGGSSRAQSQRSTSRSASGSGRSSRSTSGRSPSSAGSKRSSGSKSSSGTKSGSGSKRSPGTKRSSGSSSSARSSGGTRKRSSSGSTSGRSSGSSRSSGAKGTSSRASGSSGGRSSTGRSTGSKGTGRSRAKARSSSGEHEGRQRSRSSRQG